MLYKLRDKLYGVTRETVSVRRGRRKKSRIINQDAMIATTYVKPEKS